jgi:hypothetical protein
MQIVSPDRDASWPDGMLAGGPWAPWSVRLAGPASACPALELYEAGDLLDVISATSVARRLLRGARSVVTETGPLAIAWGRLPATGIRPEAWFCPRRRDGGPQAAAIFWPAGWCWIAVGDGQFKTVTVRAGGEIGRRRLARCVPCC